MAKSQAKSKPIVGVVKTSPDNVIDDYYRLLELAEMEKYVSKNIKTALKLNLSWSLYYPACSTEPWQLEGVLNSLKMHGYKKNKVTAVENQTVVTNPWKGAYGNKWNPILKKYQIPYKPLTDVKWIKYKPKSKMLAMTHLFGEIYVPQLYMGSNVIHFPTIKTHGHTITTGAMKNAFGGLIPRYRHHAHKMLDEVLVDLLIIQKEIHPGIFAVMDGTVAGNGAGPRTMEPFIGNTIIASNDQVAIDAVSAKIMGFDPMKIPYIKIAHDKGLGMGDVDQIEIAGMGRKEFNKLNFHFETKKSPIIQWDQRIRKGTSNIHWLHKFLFHSPFFKSFIFASEFYHDKLWYPTIGKSKINAFNKTEWGQLFEKYSYGPKPKSIKVSGQWDPY